MHGHRLRHAFYELGEGGNFLGKRIGRGARVGNRLLFQCDDPVAQLAHFTGDLGRSARKAFKPVGKIGAVPPPCGRNFQRYEGEEKREGDQARFYERHLGSVVQHCADGPGNQRHASRDKEGAVAEHAHPRGAARPRDALLPERECSHESPAPTIAGA